MPSPTSLVVKNGSKICGHIFLFDTGAIIAHDDKAFAICETAFNLNDRLFPTLKLFVTQRVERILNEIHHNVN